MFDSLPASPVGKTWTEQRPHDAFAWRPHFRRGRFSGACKRALDIVAALFVLLALWPALVLIAVAIRIESPGAALFRQQRTGLNGRVFTILKFRSMTAPAVGEPAPLSSRTRDDRRITRIGAFIRATSLDELPQMLNILKGDMSLVGPRPHALEHDIHYAALLPDYPRRFTVRPGLTGLAQVSGYLGEIHQLSCMSQRIEADVAYASGWSFRDDLLIIARTFPVVLQRARELIFTPRG